MERPFHSSQRDFLFLVVEILNHAQSDRYVMHRPVSIPIVAHPFGLLHATLLSGIIETTFVTDYAGSDHAAIQI